MLKVDDWKEIRWINYPKYQMRLDEWIENEEEDWLLEEWMVEEDKLLDDKNQTDVMQMTKWNVGYYFVRYLLMMDLSKFEIFLYQFPN